MTDLRHDGPDAHASIERQPIVAVMPSCLTGGCGRLAQAVLAAQEQMAKDRNDVEILSCTGRKCLVLCGVETRDMPGDHYLRRGINYDALERPIETALRSGARLLDSSEVAQIPNR
jgi:hypothetical protein